MIKRWKMAGLAAIVVASNMVASVVGYEVRDYQVKQKPSGPAQVLYGDIGVTVLDQMRDPSIADGQPYDRLLVTLSANNERCQELVEAYGLEEAKEIIKQNTSQTLLDCCGVTSPSGWLWDQEWIDRSDEYLHMDFTCRKDSFGIGDGDFLYNIGWGIANNTCNFPE